MVRTTLLLIFFTYKAKAFILLSCALRGRQLI